MNEKLRITRLSLIYVILIKKSVRGSFGSSLCIHFFHLSPEVKTCCYGLGFHTFFFESENKIAIFYANIREFCTLVQKAPSLNCTNIVNAIEKQLIINNIVKFLIQKNYSFFTYLREKHTGIGRKMSKWLSSSAWSV